MKPALQLTSARGCVWTVVGNDHLIVTYCDDAGTAEQWRAYMKMLQGLRTRRSVRFLIYCGAVPSRDVLGQLASAARAQPWQVALISPSTAVRFAASTFSLIVKGFRFFSPDRVTEALQHLGCDEGEQQAARRSLASLRGPESSLSPPG